MNSLLSYSDEKKNPRNEGVLLPKSNEDKPQIKEGMTPKEIGNIISDHLLSFVDKAIQSYPHSKSTPNIGSNSK